MVRRIPHKDGEDGSIPSAATVAVPSREGPGRHLLPWWNGIHSALRAQAPRGREGSIPSIRTNYFIFFKRWNVRVVEGNSLQHY